MNQQIAACVPGELFGDIVSVDAMSAGMSGALVHSLVTSTGNYVLRIFQGAQADWERSLKILRVVADEGIAPALLHVDTQRQATVSQKITGLPFVAALANPATGPTALHSLTSQLAQLHALPTAGLASSKPLDFTREAWTAQSSRPGFPVWALDLAKRLDAIALLLAQDKRLVLSHCDLNPGNILWDGTRVWLVDWDRAGLSHPWLDLASLANFLSLSDLNALQLLQMQEQVAIAPAQEEIFSVCRDLARIAYGCVFLGFIPDMEQMTFPSLAETQPLAQCFARVFKGELDLKSVEAQAMIGSAFFKQSLVPS